jgi:hypothetical protein
MNKNKLFDRVRLQVLLRTVLTEWPEDGYEIIQAALEREIKYSDYLTQQHMHTHAHKTVTIRSRSDS